MELRLVACRDYMEERMKALVTLDGSKASESILATARELFAASPGIEVHLLRVVDPGSVHGTTGAEVGDPRAAPPTGLGMPVLPRRVVESPSEAEARVQREATAALESLAHQQLGQFAPRCHVEWSGDTSDAIVQMAEKLDVNVIVMATHGRSGLSRAVMGSVAEAVIRKSRRPVLVQRPSS
jgi:nucleotide-binding universal stress UspA family protein